MALKLKNSPSPAYLVSRVCVRCMAVRLSAQTQHPYSSAQLALHLDLRNIFVILWQLVGKLSECLVF